MLQFKYPGALLMDASGNLLDSCCFTDTWKGINKDGNAGHCDVTLERKG